MLLPIPIAGILDISPEAVPVALMFGVSIGGLAFVIAQSLMSGAEAYSGAYSEDTARGFEDVFLFIPPRRIAELGWAAGAILFLLFFFAFGSFASLPGFLAGLLLGSVAGIIGLNTPRYVLTVLKKRRLRKFNEQLVETLSSMSNALRAGFNITQAFETVVREGQNPIAQEFGVFLQQTRLGVSFSDAMKNMDERVGSQDLTLVITAIETARRSGGNLTEIFDKIAATIRERMRIEARIRTLTAQGRLQGWIVGSFPVAIAVGLFMWDPGLMKGFVTSGIGVTLVSVAVLLIVGGALLIRKIINIDV